MCKVKACVVDILCNDTLNLVVLAIGSENLKMVSLELPKIEIGTEVLLSIKPTFVALAKNLSGELSYSNMLDATIETIEMGEILCSVTLVCNGYALESIITKESAVAMKLHKNDKVTALIKATEISICEILS